MWFSALPRLNQIFDGNNTKCTKHNEVTHLAITATFTALHGGFDTPHACMLRSVVAVLDRAPDKDWDVGREMISWGLTDGLVLLPDDGDCGTNLSDE